MSDYPQLNSISADAGGGPLTYSMLESAIKRLTDPARIRREQEYRAQLEDDLNLRLKTFWASLHGKTIDELTDQDMTELNEALFKSWLKYKGLTEDDFDRWLNS